MSLLYLKLKNYVIEIYKLCHFWGLDISTPDNSTPYKSRLATPILQWMKFNLSFARVLSVESYCLHYAFKLFTHNL